MPIKAGGIAGNANKALCQGGFAGSPIMPIGSPEKPIKAAILEGIAEKANKARRIARKANKDDRSNT